MGLDDDFADPPGLLHETNTEPMTWSVATVLLSVLLIRAKSQIQAGCGLAGNCDSCRGDQSVESEADMNTAERRIPGSKMKMRVDHLVPPDPSERQAPLNRSGGLSVEISAPRTSLVNYRLDSGSGTIVVTSPQPLWLYAYFDATDLCEFVLQCCKLCIDEDLAAEVQYLRCHDQTVRELETWLDMRQARLNTLIDLIVQGNGQLSRRKRSFVQELTDDELRRIEEVVGRNFAELRRSSPD